MTKDVVNTYLKQSVGVIVGITLLALLLAYINGGVEQMTTPLCVSIVFQLVACIAYGLVWKWVSATSPASIPTLYMAASAFRMFAAVIVVMAYSLLTDNRDSIRLFVVTFLIYYFVILIYDTWYFVKIEKKFKK